MPARSAEGTALGRSTCFISFRGGAISPIAPLFFLPTVSAMDLHSLSFLGGSLLRSDLPAATSALWGHTGEAIGGD